MSVGRKYLWLVMMMFIYCLSTITLAAAQEITPGLLIPEHQHGDDIQSMVSLRYGSRGEDVKLIQSYLIKNGFLRDKVDGMFGRLTQQAVKDFQRMVGLPVDGVVSGPIFDALKEYKPAGAVHLEQDPKTDQVSHKSVTVADQQRDNIVPAGAVRFNDSPVEKRRKMITNTPSRGAVSRTIRPQEISASNREGQANINTVLHTETVIQVQPVFKTDKNPTISSPEVKTVIGIPDRWRPIRLEATAYTRYDAGCTDYTYRGNYLQRGLVAVDPTVIPLGTRMFIPGYGFAVADDIGGAIKGHKVDLSMDTLTEAFAYGRRAITAYIIDWSLLT